MYRFGSSSIWHSNSVREEQNKNKLLEKGETTVSLFLQLKIADISFGITAYQKLGNTYPHPNRNILFHSRKSNIAIHSSNV